MENDKMINFSTRDLVLATYLRYNNIDLIEGYQPNNKSWVFSNPDECIKLSLKLKNGKAEVEPLYYESCRRNLLGMVHDKRNNSD
jgi:hypothetical protein